MRARLFKTISKRNRWLVLGVSGLLGLVYFMPLWMISLKAPQYRDGLTMFVWLNKITGGGEFDLKNINLLNHYVGMKEIHSENFIEFTYIPYILGFMIIGSFITYAYPKVIMVYLGLASFLLAAFSGLYDLQRWERIYGHELDPNAALSIPGISFEPPLLGCKAMMNFNTCSWPYAGAILLILSGGLIFYILLDETLKYKRCKQE